MARYELIIKVENSGEKQNMTTSIPNSTNRTNNRVKVAGEDKLKEISANAVKSLSVNSFKRVITTGASMIFAQRTQDLISFGMGVGETVYNLGLLTKTFGASGFAFGMISQLTSLGINVWKFNYEKDLQQETLGIARQRAGWQFNQSRRGN